MDIPQSKVALLVLQAFIKKHLEYSIRLWQAWERAARRCITDKNWCASDTPQAPDSQCS